MMVFKGFILAIVILMSVLLFIGAARLVELDEKVEVLELRVDRLERTEESSETRITRLEQKLTHVRAKVILENAKGGGLK